MYKFISTALPTALLAAGMCALHPTAYAQIPIEYETQLLRAPLDAGYNAFGQAVDIDADTAVVGAPLDDENGDDFGTVYVYTRADGEWSLQQQLVPSSPPALRNCGKAVAVSGDTVAFNCSGIYGEVVPRTYFFERADGVWTESAVFAVPPYNYFGEDTDVYDISGLALDGDVAIVGDHALPNYTPGRAHMYVRNSRGWSLLWELEREVVWPFDEMGSAIAIQDRTAVVGAPNTLIDTTDQKGAIHIYESDGSTTNWPGYTWFRQTGAAQTGFGATVAVDGDIILVGRAVSNGRRGQVTAYQRSDSGWAQQSTIVPSDVRWDPDTGAAFGSSVAMDNGIAAVSSNDGTDHSLRTIYILRQAGEFAWSEEFKLRASEGALGKAAISGGTVIAGATGYDRHNEPGAAYLFELPGFAPLPVDDEGPVARIQNQQNEADKSFRLFAQVNDTNAGGSAVASATYTLYDNTWTSEALPMEARDGTFDEPNEAVQAYHAGGLPAGVYNLCVTGTDVEGNAGDEACALLASYDRNGGSLTGSGWIASPAGAYAPDNRLAGKAKFEIVAKFKKDSYAPTGNVKFQLPAANLSFSSTEITEQFTWLVVNESWGQIRGLGKINGEGHYGFMLTVVDAALDPDSDTDLLRIKIWDNRNDNAIVYDNQPGASDIDAPVTALGGGSVNILKSGKK